LLANLFFRTNLFNFCSRIKQLNLEYGFVKYTIVLNNKEEGSALFKCIIGLYGLPRGIVGGHQIEVELKDETSLIDVIAALRRALPKLEGPVILTGKDKLTEHYAFNINGRFYTDDKEIRIRSGDNVALLALAAGG
jgi:molybdopterin converting factor small subunit